ncbi:putative outer membrane protein pmp10 precursor [Methanobrevibacter cuticularis]|uniref:Putative outer membrane protein pmp10 n=1 Tax=Methanobrevibacter cuticularis TaxID=47311 RepID=A0A166EL67_9EURY|nr:right-handed parallel beta-helix repeat-containing protein [Methanobrevibacter cuticularis]KZX16779.1 putative outer membrane protein pmp10 precursor [Methanobrevibacter cuticularis]
MVGGVSAADKTITNTTDGGLKTAIDGMASGDRITLDNGVYSGVNNRGIVIDKDLTIVGKSKDKVIIDAQKKDRIFTIESGSLTLINLTIINGYSQAFESGGAISNGGNLNISGCTFSSNQAFESGGAISNGGNLNISGCTFSSNQTSWDGGAISNGGNLNISGCTFSSNQAFESGGAISNDGNLSISGSTFNSNRAKLDGGGAIFNDGNLTISGSTFNSNRAKLDGGAICSFKGILRLNSVTFKNNIVGNKYNAIGLWFGAKVYKTKVTITPAEWSNIPSSTKKPDLKISKIKKSGNYRYVYIKNIGKAAAGKSYLGVYVGKKKVKTVKVGFIKAGKYLKVKVLIAKKYKNKQKVFKVDIKNVVKESNEKNNSLKAK